jgi:hypothetical protein
MTKKECKSSSVLAKFSRCFVPCWAVEDVKEANYCKEHGCENCEYANKKQGFMSSSIEGKEFCSPDCMKQFEEDFEKKSEEERKQIEEEERKLRIEQADKNNEQYSNLQERFEENYASFSEQIRGIDLSKWKGSFIRGQIGEETFISEWHSIIESCKLERVEKDRWKEIYKKGSESREANLTLVVQKEKSFLLSLAKQKKLQEKEKKKLIGEIKTELNCFEPQIDLEDLSSISRNYESLKNKELKEKKNQIIEEIKNKREEKKLSALLIKADACVDDEIELKEFIRKLEKFTLGGASEYKENAYKSQENKVDEVIGNLWNRLEILEEEVNLTCRQDEACRNFNEWLKEAEGLVLPNDCPCFEFEKNIRNFTDKDLILSQQNQAFQGIVEEFKDNVKSQLGAEKFDGEYQAIDKAKDFSGVKLMREVVGVNRLVLEKKKDPEERSWELIEGEINKLKSLLDSKSEIDLSEVNVLVEKLKEEISNARSAKNQKQEESRPNSSSPFLWPGIITVLVVFFSAILYFVVKKRKHFCSKN